MKKVLEHCCWKVIHKGQEHGRADESRGHAPLLPVSEESDATHKLKALQVLGTRIHERIWGQIQVLLLDHRAKAVIDKWLGTNAG